MKNYTLQKLNNDKNFGFTLVELMITIAIAATLMAIALPNFSSFLVEPRVDNEISQLQR